MRGGEEVEGGQGIVDYGGRVPLFSSSQSVTDFELPLVELGFSSSAELLQRVPGLEVVRPPNVDSVMVYSTWSGSGPQPVEEEGEKGGKSDKEVSGLGGRGREM